MEFIRTSEPHVPVRKTASNLSVTRQTSSGCTPVKKDPKTTRLKRISSISNPKHIRSSRIKRHEPDPSKFLSLENIVEKALRQGIQVGGDKLLLDGENNELEVSISILQHHLEQIEKLRNEYTHQLKIHVGASNLDLAYEGQKVRKKSKALLKTNMKKLNENLLDLEDQMFDCMGYLQITFKGLLDIPRVINNDCYEACFELSEQKWKTKGTIKNKVQKWQDEHFMMTILGDDTLMDVQALQIRRFLGNVQLGSAKFNAYDLISLHPQNVLIVLKGATHVKLNLEVKWRFGYDDPDYGRIMEFNMHDVIIGSAKQECIKKRVRQMSIQHARRVRDRIGINTEVSVDMSRRASSQDDDLLELELTPLQDKRSMPEMSSREEDLTQSTTSQVADLTDNFNKVNPERNVCSVLHRSPSQFKRGQVGYKPILIESDSARNELMSNLQLDTGSNIDSSSIGSVCHLLEAYENLWVCLEDKKELCDHCVLTELEARLNKLSVLTRNRGMKHERTPSLTTSETDALDAFDFLNESNNIFRDELRADLKVSSDSGINLTGRRDSLSESVNSGTDEYKSSTQPLQDEYSSDEEELNFILQEMVDMSTVALERGETDTDLDVFSNTASPNRVPSPSSRGDSLPTDDGSIDDLSVLTTGLSNLDILLTAHLVYCEGLIRNIKLPGPLQYKSNKSISLLQGEVKVLDIILDNMDKEDVKSIDLVPNLHKSRELLLLWKACCGDKDFVAPLDNFSLALDRMFGEVWKNYPDVAHFVFPTIATQITTTTFDDGEHPDVQSLTLFQFYSHFKSKLISGLEEYVSEVAEDLSLYGGLTSEERYVVNVTLKRMAGMGYNVGILRAIPQMLLKPNESYQIADNYLKNITRDNRILDEVGSYFVSLLEQGDQTIRQGACRALGRIKYAPSIVQLKYVREMDVTAVRHEAKQALNRLCPEFL